MQSASLSVRIQLQASEAVSRARASLGEGRAASGVLVLLLAFAIAKSTVTYGWVPGIEIITPIALLGAVVMGVLALTPIAEPISLLIGALLAPIVAVYGAWPQLHEHHPNDVIGPQLVRTWYDRFADGTALSDLSLYLAVICLLLWITGGWLSWCVLRWRKSLLGLIPGAAAFATNLLNIMPGDTGQNGYVLAILVLTLALLLWTNYTGSIAGAVNARVKLTGDARWDFWESGLVAMAALIVIAILLPPLSTNDKTLSVETGVFQDWAQLQQQLSHPGFLGTGGGGAGVTGFSSDVKLSGALQRTRDPVFVYTAIGDLTGPRYFRGLNITQTINGEWRFSDTNGRQVTLQRNEIVPYDDFPTKLAVAGATVKMQHPPVGFSNVLFYPGQFYKMDRTSQATQVPLPLGFNSHIYSVDRLDSLSPQTSGGTYITTIEYSTATEADLQGASSNFPGWVEPYMSLPAFGYRPPDVLDKEHNLALDIVAKAGAKTEYDVATAIQDYLRNGNNFTYTLEPPSAPANEDRMNFFLFDPNGKHQGYCEYFATAMGDMLRSLGIPTRLVNGYGPGAFDPQVNGVLVRSDDAHTWVEVYFPNYGWIPFEPTADGTYNVIPRGQQDQNACLRDEGCDTPVAGGTTGPGATPSAGGRGNRQVGGPDIPLVGGGGFSFSSLGSAGTLTKILAVLVAMLLLALAAATRYLRPRSVMAVWRRVLTLASLAGAERRPGETPLELGRRLQRAFPEAAEPVGALAGGFTIAAYAPPDMASNARATVMESWSMLRPLLLRRVFARLRPSRF